MEIINMPIETMTSETMTSESLPVDSSMDDHQIIIKEYYPNLDEQIIKLNNVMLDYEQLVTDNSGFLIKYEDANSIKAKSIVFDDYIYVAKLSSKLKCILNIIIAAKNIIYNYKKLENIKNIEHRSILQNYYLYLNTYYDYIIEHKINIDSQQRYVKSIIFLLFNDKT